jgi:LmeA-like phospholipid-binding
MLGTFTGFKGATGADTDFGVQFLNNVASKAIAHLFSASQSVKVEIGCYPASKILQGAIDSFKMQGEGLVIRQQFPVTEMSFETDAVAIDFGAMMRGDIRLKQPTQAIAQVVLSEAGINQAFQAELVQKRLVDLYLSDTEPDLGISEPITFSDVNLQLLAENRVILSAQCEWQELTTGESQIVPLQVITTLAVERRRRILFNDPQFQAADIPTELQPLSERLSYAFVKLLNEMVDLDRFDLDGVMLRINRLEVQTQKLVLSGYAQIEQFPKTGG